MITQGKTFVDGIQNVYRKVKGSCSMLILTNDGIIAARDHYGRTPIVIGKKSSGYALAFDSHSFANLDYAIERFVGPGEIVKVTANGYEQLLTPNEKMQICSFLWIYYGYPSAEYEGVNVENTRYICFSFLTHRIMAFPLAMPHGDMNELELTPLYPAWMNLKRLF